MATRSTIALEYADGSVDRVYCHWDGYLGHNGRILQEHYSDPFKLRDLIDLGDVSSLRPNIGDKHIFSRFDSDISADEYEEKYGDMTIFYGRDRGEDETDVGAVRFKDYADYRALARFEEYNYILRRDGHWYVEYYGEFDGLLTEALEREAMEATE
jgi:hypothetical protein